MIWRADLRVAFGGNSIDVQPRPVETVERSTHGITPFPRGSVRTVGCCIYCGSTDSLSDEHVLPFGLGGPSWISKASCLPCARQTSLVELRVLRGALRIVRAAWGMPSRTKNKGAALDVPVEVLRGDTWEQVRLERSIAPLLMPFPQYAPPRYRTGATGTGIELVGFYTVNFGADPSAVASSLSTKGLRLQVNGESYDAFARMLGKIAYAQAAAEGRVGHQDALPIVRSILGLDNDIGRWVGMVNEASETYAGLLHRVRLAEQEGTGVLRAAVQLFAAAGAPSYEVIVRPERLS
jgi:hypothetical protein